MASNKNAYGLCDVCGWRYPLKVLRKNSYNSLVCPTDYEGRYDAKNHPQNFSAKGGDNDSVKNARPELNNDRDVVWELADGNWEDIAANWNSVSYGDL
jgi:hypothetical protein